LVTPEEYEALGLYDPGPLRAPARLALLDYLVELGATAEDLVECRDELPGLASLLGLRPGSERLTLAELAERTGVPEDFLERVNRAAGLPFTGPGARLWYDADLQTMQLNQAASALFGEETVFQLLRVLGSSMARVADAIVSAFLVNVQVPLMDGASQDEVDLAVARANAAAVSLLPVLVRAMDALLRNHLIVARRNRTVLDAARTSGYDTKELAVGFVDLVGSTSLSLRLPMRDLGAALGEFETRAADTITDHGARLVKLIGDEVMFVAADAGSAAEIALALINAFAAHPVLPQVRAGLAFGEVMSRDGDCFGPVVNLAARVVKAAAPGTVAVTGELRSVLSDSYRFSRLEPHVLKGFDQGMELFELGR
jgi:class 3 adenylate cyclase